MGSGADMPGHEGARVLKRSRFAGDGWGLKIALKPCPASARSYTVLSKYWTISFVIVEAESYGFVSFRILNIPIIHMDTSCAQSNKIDAGLSVRCSKAGYRCRCAHRVAMCRRPATLADERPVLDWVL